MAAISKRPAASGLEEALEAGVTTTARLLKSTPSTALSMPATTHPTVLLVRTITVLPSARTSSRSRLDLDPREVEAAAAAAAPVRLVRRPITMDLTGTLREP